MIRMMYGANSNPSNTNPTRMSTKIERRFAAKAIASSFERVSFISVYVGMNAAASEPSPKSPRSIFGITNATPKLSAMAVAPRKCVRKISRTNPEILLRNVPLDILPTSCVRFSLLLLILSYNLKKVPFLF